MTHAVQITVDQHPIDAEPGQTILKAAERAGIYIPRLCHRDDVRPRGSCRVCSVLINGVWGAACTTPVAPGMYVENDTPRVQSARRHLVEMLLIEGSHFCMFCERSGSCELQALAYRLGVTAPRYPHLSSRRQVDASHPDILLDHHRCIQCGRCVEVFQTHDKKVVVGFVGRGRGRHLEADSPEGLGGTTAEASDEALTACPVGALLLKRVGYSVPIGQRRYDEQPIGREIGSLRQESDS